MPMHSDRRRRGRRSRSELDWFAEDPWGETESAAARDDDDDVYPGMWEPDDDDLEAWDEAGGPWSEEPLDDWAPIRPRSRRGAP